jgi:hypothetical protein
MSDEKDKHRSEADAELEREVRKGRKFSLAEAIGRLAGPGMMKGVSPITRKQQAEAKIEEYLRPELADAGDALCIVVLRHVKQSKELLDNYDQPLVVLTMCLRSLLNSECLLQELVREADIEWGRLLGERPYFEQESLPTDPADPYTVESVRTRLSRLIEKLPGGI